MLATCQQLLYLVLGDYIESLLGHNKLGYLRAATVDCVECFCIN